MKSPSGQTVGNEVGTKQITGTKEWAARNVNIASGCENDCRYCYAKGMAIRFGQCKASTWKQPRINTSKVEKGYNKTDGTIMFPTSHDITPANVEQSLVVLEKILKAGNRVLIVTKPHQECVKLICEKLSKYKKQILFRFTIGSADDRVLSYWEPGATGFNERLASLKWAFNQGFQTSVSSEPLLDRQINNVVEAVRPYVTDALWIGRANRLNGAIAMNCPGDSQAKTKAKELIDLINDDYVKRLYEQYKADSMIKWKDSIKKVVGITMPDKAGLDI